MRKAVTFIMTLITLAACQDPSMFLPQLDDASSRVVSAAEEGLVVTDNQVPLRLDAQSISRYRAQSLAVTVLDGAAKLLHSLTFTANDLSGTALLWVPLPETLPQGSYSLTWNLSYNDRSPEKGSASFFVVRAQFKLDAVQLFPYTSEPGSVAIARVRTSVASGLKPWVRWKLAEQVLKEGLLSDGNNLVHFKVPSTNGSYPLVVELFPFAPKSDGWSFSSSVKAKAQLLVSENPGSSLKIGKFSPRALYSNLFLFEGSYRNLVAIDRTLVPRGSPAPVLADDMLAYSLDAANTLTAASLSLVMKDAAPVNQIFDLLLQPDVAGPGRLFDISDTSGPQLQLSAETGGVIALSLSIGAIKVRLVTDKAAFEPGKQIFIRSGIRRTASAINLFLVVDGKLYTSEALKLPTANNVVDLPAGNVSCVLGGAAFKVLAFGSATGDWAWLAASDVASRGSKAVFFAQSEAELAIPVLHQGEALTYRMVSEQRDGLVIAVSLIKGQQLVQKNIELMGNTGNIEFAVSLSGKTLRLVASGKQIAITEDFDPAYADFALRDAGGKAAKLLSLHIFPAKTTDL